MSGHDGFIQYVEMTCTHCGCADYYSGKNIEKAKEYWRDIGGIFHLRKPFCNEKCRDTYLKVQRGEIKFGLDDGSPLPERTVS